MKLSLPDEPTSDWPVERLLATAYDERAFLLTAADQSNRIEEVVIAWEALVASLDAPDTHVGTLAEAVRLARARQPLTADRLDAWQAAILNEQAAHGYPTVAPEWIGRMRSGTCEVWVGTQRRHRGTPAARVAGRMAVYLRRLEERLGTKQDDEDPLRLLAESHLELQDIHPYLDGTGRTARALALYVAVRLDVAPGPVHPRRPRLALRLRLPGSERPGHGSLLRPPPACARPLRPAPCAAAVSPRCSRTRRTPT